MKRTVLFPPLFSIALCAAIAQEAPSGAKWPPGPNAQGSGKYLALNGEIGLPGNSIGLLQAAIRGVPLVSRQGSTLSSSSADTAWDDKIGGYPGISYGLVQTGVESFAFSGSNMYVGGTFGAAGGAIANGIARWDGSHWSALGSGMSY